MWKMWSERAITATMQNSSWRPFKCQNSAPCVLLLSPFNSILSKSVPLAILTLGNKEIFSYFFLQAAHGDEKRTIVWAVLFFRQELLQIKICNFWCKNFFDCPTGLASALIAQFSFLAKSALKIVANQSRNFYVITFFNILCHFVVIAAFQICSVSVSRKFLCRLTEQIFYFYFLDHAKYRERKYSISPKKKKKRQRF